MIVFSVMLGLVKKNIFNRFFKSFLIYFFSHLFLLQHRFKMNFKMVIYV